MSKLTRPTFSPECRHEAAQFVVEKGYTIRGAAESMGVGLSTIDKWVKQLRAAPGGQLPRPDSINTEIIHIIKRSSLWAYLTGVLDLFACRPIGWALSFRLIASLPGAR